MTSAPSVNQMRLFSSVALENAERLMLAASCSAADAMCPFPTRKPAYPTKPPAAEPAPGSGRRRLALGRPFRLLRRIGSGPAGHHHLAAGRLDRVDRCLGGTGYLDRQRRAELALSQQADAVARPPQHPGGDQLAGVDGALGGELAGIERLLQPAQIDHLIVLLKNLVVEAALRQPAMQRGLPTLEAVQRDTAARGLPLAAAPGGLSLARSDAAADPLGPVVRARIVPDLVELHRLNAPVPRLAALTRRRPAASGTLSRIAGEGLFSVLLKPLSRIAGEGGAQPAGLGG